MCVCVWGPVIGIYFSSSCGDYLERKREKREREKCVCVCLKARGSYFSLSPGIGRRNKNTKQKTKQQIWYHSHIIIKVISFFNLPTAMSIWRLNLCLFPIPNEQKKKKKKKKKRRGGGSARDYLKFADSPLICHPPPPPPQRRPRFWYITLKLNGSVKKWERPGKFGRVSAKLLHVTQYSVCGTVIKV